MVLVALAMVAIIAMAAISIDVITLYLAREEAQRAADAAALAGARVISISGITGVDPSNGTSSWQAICGGTSSPATLAATSVALQNVVGGAVANTVNVSYSTTGAGQQSDCSQLPHSFGIDAMVTVQVQRTNLPNFFSRIWSRSGTNLSASATAEIFNSSNSASIGTSGSVVPVQPVCVKPWFALNHDPLNPSPAQNGGTWCDNPNAQGKVKSCNPLVSTADGSIQDPGISLNGAVTTVTGVIGENFWLAANCTHNGTGCVFRANPIQANFPPNGFVTNGPPNSANLLYYPGQTPAVPPTALPSCSSAGDPFEQAIAGCDQSTAYKCGVQLANTVDMSENPSTQNGDTATGVQCLIHQGNTTATSPDGQDVLNTSAFPFQIQAGTSSPLVLNAGLASGTPISASNSIVSLPIYDAANTVNTSGTSQVTVVGFLQVFINSVDQWDNMNVTVLNVTGCGNGGTTTVGPNPVAGTSSVPIRLITPQ